MKRKVSTQLAVEWLEDRWVPASVSYSAGVLSITTAFAENVTITQTANNTFTVSPFTGGKPGPYVGVNTINVTGSNGADSITIDLGSDTLTYQGKIIVNAGNG